MSITSRPRPLSVWSLRNKKRDGQPVVCITAYDYTTAHWVDSTQQVDLMLVGDSLAMTVLGHPNTLQVTVDEMIHHTKAVSRGTQRALVIGDMPFMSYQGDTHQAIENAGRFIKEGLCHGVKIEGASDSILELVRKLNDVGIPVMGHLGFTPQMINTLGGFKVQGKTLDAARKLMIDAQALANAGVFGLVLEMVPTTVASVISQALPIPVIGIGSGNGCDGQILVIDDLLGRYPDFQPKFARQYAQLGPLTQSAVSQYAQDVSTRAFPDNTVEAFGCELDETLLTSLMNDTQALGHNQRSFSKETQQPQWQDEPFSEPLPMASPNPVTDLVDPDAFIRPSHH